MPKTQRRKRTRSLTTICSNELMRAVVAVEGAGRPALRVTDAPLYGVLDVVVDGNTVAHVGVGAGGAVTVELPSWGRRVDVEINGRLIASGPIPDRAMPMGASR